MGIIQAIVKTSRTFLFAAALLVLVVGFARLLSHAGAGPRVPPHIVVLSMWYSNREQWVTFRTEPPGTALIYIDLVSGSMMKMPSRRHLAVLGTSSPFPAQGKPIAACVLLRSQDEARAWEESRFATRQAAILWHILPARAHIECELRWPSSARDLETTSSGFAAAGSRRP